MGTTLTGTTPQDTYDSLIKVTDNGPLSGTAKYLSDGLGNDSKLALGTSGVGIGTTSPVTIFTAEDTNANVAVVNVVGTSPNYIFDVRDDDTSVFRVTGSRNVGIGTTTSSYDTNKVGSTHRFLNVQAGSSSYAVGTLAGNQSANGDRLGYLTFVNDNNSASYKYTAWIGAEVDGTTANQQGGRLIFSTMGNGSAAGPVERMRITQSGVLDLISGQLKFPATQVASADPNTLDDYEEGTFNFTLSFGGASTGITYSARGGTYTKIGRQVTVVGYIELSNKGTATGNAELSGLPFTIGAGSPNYSGVTLSNVSNITFTDFPSLRADVGATKCTFLTTSSAGSLTALDNTNFANTSNFIVSLTYFV